MSDATQLTSEEIQQYREEFKDYPKALDTLDVIQECDGNLQDAIILISMRETGREPDRALLDLDELAKQARPVVCAKATRKGIDIASILSGLFGTYGIAFTLFLYIINNVGLEKFCKDFPPNAQNPTEQNPAQ